MKTPLFAHHGHRRLDLEWGLVDTLAGQGIEDVSNRHDASLQWDLLVAEPLRVAGAIPSLVMTEGDVRRRVQNRRLRTME